MKGMLWLSLVVLCFYGESVAQSLAEAARREGERRKSLEAQGIEGKVIDEETLPRQPGGDRAESRRLPEVARPRAGGESPTGRRTHAGPYRSRLTRIDNEIRRDEERLAVLRQRHEAERFALPRVGRNAAGRTFPSRERTFWQIQEMESKLKRLKQERLETYDAGKKAGFLPGELDGHGIVP